MPDPTACVQCGSEYSPRSSRAKYCSKPCANRAADAKRKASGAKAEAKKRYEARRKAGQLSPNATCEQCSTPFRKQTATQLGRFCTPSCHHAWLRSQPTYQSKGDRRRASAQHKMDKAQEGTIGQHQWIAGACQSCGDTYIVRPTGGKYPEAYCSKGCRAREIRHRRRARMRTPIPTPTPTRVIRAKVYERDQWTCQLCSEPVRMDMVHTLGTPKPHPLAPTIDHVIPLARGGTHDMDNVQTAHFMCNCLKSDRHEVA